MYPDTSGYLQCFVWINHDQPIDQAPLLQQLYSLRPLPTTVAGKDGGGVG